MYVEFQQFIKKKMHFPVTKQKEKCSHKYSSHCFIVAYSWEVYAECNVYSYIQYVMYTESIATRSFIYTEEYYFQTEKWNKLSSYCT